VNEYRQYLVNFGTMIVRALMTPLVNKKSKVRVEAYKCLQEVMYIGSFK